MVLSYTTPKRDRQTIEVQFELDGEEFTARKPKDSVMVFLAAAQGESSSTADKVYAVMQFISGALTPAAQARIQARLRDFDDDLEVTDLLPIMEDLAAKFGDDANPEPGEPSRPGRVITPDGEAVDITPATGLNRAARRAKPAKKSAPVKAAATKKKPPATSRGRALPK